MKTAIAPKAKAKDVFAGFSSDWGEGMTTEEYSDMLRNEYGKFACNWNTVGYG
jgi:hypothetical protein